jgi:hypothetical protein
MSDSQSMIDAEISPLALLKTVTGGVCWALFAAACSSSGNAVTPAPAPVTAGGAAPSGGGSAPQASGAAGMPPTGGVSGSAGSESGGGQLTAGFGGQSSGGSGGVASAGAATAGSGGAADAGDTPPVHPLHVIAPPGEHVHTANGDPAGVNNGAPKLMAKLIVNLDDGLYQFGLARGFHVMGVELAICPIDYVTREGNGDCRLEVFDAVDRDPRITITKAQSISGKVAANLQTLEAQYPEEDWGFFLNADGSVRWSDVGFTGHSHRAQSATRFAVAVRAYRAVARSGPRDNVCGTGVATGDYDPAKPPYDPNCPLEKISAWLDDKPKTPIDRFFGFVGKADPEYGDIIFTMERMGFIGKPMNVTTGAAPYAGTHRFYADAGHDGFEGAAYDDAMNIAWGVPQENIAWAKTH